MIKTIFKIIGYIISILCFFLTLFFLFQNKGNGISLLNDLFSDGFFNGLKEFFVNMWDGVKAVLGL